MRNRIAKIAISLTVGLLPMKTMAQLSSNPDKFLGNITTEYSVDWGNEPFWTLWNQITPENESKWGSVEGTRGRYNWGCDNAFNYAKNHNFPHKFHALVWGSQYPGWLPSLSPNERYEAIVSWYDAVKKKYNTLPLIDVVNEAVGTHQKDNPMIKESLFGAGKTGYDWLIKAFEMASERWPDAILIYNDFNTFQWNTNEYIDLVRTLRDAGAPVDAYGCQSHDMLDMNGNRFTNFRSVCDQLQTALKMPFYSTEYDVGTDNDNIQLECYKDQIAYMWERDYCAGITLWGYNYGHTWTTNGNSGIIKDGKDRPAMTWLREYMASNAAKSAKSPFPGMKKEASIYVKPASLKMAKNDTIDVTVRARMATKTIEKIELFEGTKLIATMTEAPYVARYSSSTSGTKTLKAVATTTDGSTYERLSRVSVLSGTKRRQPYQGIVPTLPGTIEAENFDEGVEGVSFHDDGANAGVRTHRTDGGGVDIYKAGEGYAIGNTKDGEWLDYTVDVQEDGLYSLDAVVSAASEGGSFYIFENVATNMTYVTNLIDVPKTGSNANYQQLHIRLTTPLKAGRQVLTFFVYKGGFYIDKLSFTRLEVGDDMSVTVKASPTRIEEGDSTVITATASSPTTTIDHVNVYANDMLVGTMTEAPYTLVWHPAVKGTYALTAIATDAEGRESKLAKSAVKVIGHRMPYKGVIALPGTIEAENFDQGGEGLSFHDTDTKNEGDATYRTDNEGLDLVKAGSGTAIGYTANGEWTEYSVNVTEPGKYSIESTCSNGSDTNGGFLIYLVKGSTTTAIGKVTVTPTGGWNTYKVMTGKLAKELAAGEQILRFTISGANCNIDKVKFICTENTGVETLTTDTRKKADSIYNLSGQKVDANYKGLVIMGGKKMMRR